jgi:hypothetical protein
LVLALYLLLQLANLQQKPVDLVFLLVFELLVKLAKAGGSVVDRAA